MELSDFNEPHTVLIITAQGRVKIEKKEDDPIACRISTGGNPDNGHYYFVFRGTVEQVDHVLHQVLSTWEAYKENGPNRNK